MQKVLCTLFGSIPNKLTTCFHKRWMRQLLAAEVHRQTKPTFDHTWSVDETMWLRASCFYVKYPAFLHIWFSLQTFNIVIDCKDSYARAKTHILSIHQYFELLRGHAPTYFPFGKPAGLHLHINHFINYHAFFLDYIGASRISEDSACLQQKRGTIKGVWQSYCQSQHKLYLSSSPAFWITYLFSTHAL